MSRAFSLFELLIVIAIMSILTAVSYPLYTQHVARVNCQQAQMSLYKIANLLERERSLRDSFMQLDIQSVLSQQTVKLPYRFYFSRATKAHYTINAAATKPQGLTPSCQLISVSDDTFKHAIDS